MSHVIPRRREISLGAEKYISHVGPHWTLGIQDTITITLRSQRNGSPYIGRQSFPGLDCRVK
jgi:hypothetical protein